MRAHNTRCQSFSEVSLLMSIIVIALAGMQVYAKRGLQAHYRSAVNTAVQIASSVAQRETLLLQYEPYYQEENSQEGGSFFKIKQANEEQAAIGEDKIRKIVQKQYFYQEGEVRSKQGVGFEAGDVWE